MQEVSGIPGDPSLDWKPMLKTFPNLPSLFPCPSFKSRKETQAKSRGQIS